MNLKVIGILFPIAIAAFGVDAKSKDSAIGITAYRAKLMAQGWQPRETFGTDADGVRWSHFGDAGGMYRAGLVEVESCSGTGLNYCTFNYRKGEKCLAVSTQGEFKKGAYEPIVIGSKKECPPADVLRPDSK